jgi:hypothetical protein
MPTQERKDLHTLLTRFNVASLGEGDANAGTNTQAAMAFTLANLARSGSGIASLGRLASPQRRPLGRHPKSRFLVSQSINRCQNKPWHSQKEAYAQR